jgi:hypothetical protein
LLTVRSGVSPVSNSQRINVGENNGKGLVNIGTAGKDIISSNVSVHSVRKKKNKINLGENFDSHDPGGGGGVVVDRTGWNKAFENGGGRNVEREEKNDILRSKEESSFKEISDNIMESKNRKTKTILSSSEPEPLLFVGSKFVNENGKEQHILEVWNDAIYMKELHVAKV